MFQHSLSDGHKGLVLNQMCLHHTSGAKKLSPLGASALVPCHNTMAPAAAC